MEAAQGAGPGHRLMPNSTPPIMLCSDTGTHWVFHCEHCKRDHHHSRGPGHRVAHCGGDGPYSETGYVLELRPPPSDEEMAAARKTLAEAEAGPVHAVVDENGDGTVCGLGWDAGIGFSYILLGADESQRPITCPGCLHQLSRGGNA